ncbi:MAG: ADP-ribosylglycohydrolase family protein [Actinomycetaceae bacterium]|nr:ADP-ribosylglycohydrolase family protein [Actinomycetaceae bacterium]MDY6082647.1 ADP-ribosylglycohydrolase family protein [Actinomycetaceae bacterium]
MQEYDRALGCLWGLALGDALGMPTQSMSSEAIAATYGSITSLHDADPSQPIAPGMPAGSVTDDTEQALLLADELIRGNGTVDPRHFADALASWEEKMRARGSLDLLGPSTTAAIEGIRRGEPLQRVGRNGTTNGAAMRIAPVAIAFSGAENDAELLAKVIEASSLTHNTTIGLAGAAAIAGSVAAGIRGASVVEALQAGVGLAAQTERHGFWQAGGSIAVRAQFFLHVTASMPRREVDGFVRDVVGTSVASQESVVAALVLAQAYVDSPYAALLTAAQIGGDTDTVAAMCGAVLGAACGMAVWPQDAIRTIQTVSKIDIASRVHKLLSLTR